jgi:hypothetical protein
MRKLLMVASLGWLARWLLDPVRGGERRSGLLRRLPAQVRELVPSAATGGGGTDAGPAPLAGNPDDARLTDKVETEIFRDADVPKGDINVNVEFGKVVLRGQVESQELIDDLVARTRGIEGVNAVENLLHLPGEPAPMHE